MHNYYKTLILKRNKMKKELIILIILLIISAGFPDIINPDALMSDEYFISSIIISALIATLSIEIIAGLIYTSWNKEISKKTDKKKFLTTIIIMNIISVPIVWYFFIQQVFKLTEITQIPLYLVLLETFAIIFESLIIHQSNKEVISYKNSLILSTVMNVSSLLLGTPLFFYILTFITLVL